MALLNAALVVYDIHLLHKPVEFNADEIAHLNVSELRWQGDVPRISQLLIKADVLYSEYIYLITNLHGALRWIIHVVFVPLDMKRCTYIFYFTKYQVHPFSPNGASSF